MAGVGWFPMDEPPIPTVDHMHERSHQHHTFLRYLSRKHPDAKLVPNYPDVDIRDVINNYLVEIEVPGVKDVNQIKCQWTSSTTLIVSGENTRPEGITRADGVTAERQGVSQNDSRDFKSLSTDGPPYLIIGERKIGYFTRRLTFPSNVDPDKMKAKLDAGVLCINIPKKAEHIPKGNGTVKIEICEG